MPEARRIENAVGGILLAAGSSLRFGGEKQLALFRGEPLLWHAANAMKGSGVDRAIAVLRPGAACHEEILRHVGLDFVVNEEAPAGMASSLRQGLISLRPDELAAVLIAACDQPLVTWPHLRCLIDRWRIRRPPAVASAYSGIVGVPAIFSSATFARLLTLEGNRGAGRLLRDLPGVEALALPQAAFDVDTQEQLQELEQQL